MLWIWAFEKGQMYVCVCVLVFLKYKLRDCPFEKEDGVLRGNLDYLGGLLACTEYCFCFQTQRGCCFDLCACL